MIGPVVRVVWAPDGERSIADRLLTRTLAAGAAPGLTLGGVRRLCPWCGAEDHGRPVLAGGREPHLSVSRTAGLTVVAVCDRAPVGIDVEAAGAVHLPGSGAVALHPSETARDAAELTVTWVRKEALLKATGHGLRLAPSAVRLSAPDQRPQLLGWPEPEPPSVQLRDVATIPGFVVAVAVLTAEPVKVVVSRASAAATRATASR